MIAVKHTQTSCDFPAHWYKTYHMIDHLLPTDAGYVLSTPAQAAANAGNIVSA